MVTEVYCLMLCRHHLTSDNAKEIYKLNA
jgi:hypothetical protein